MAEALNNAVLAQRIDLDDRYALFRVKPDRPHPPFVAGQWTEMGLPRAEREEEGPTSADFVRDGIVRRAYSIVSAPEDPLWEFFFNHVEEGGLTPWLWRLREGDRLYVEPQARGGFTLDGLPNLHTVLAVATGTGVAPFLSMLRHFRSNPPWQRFVLLHGARTPARLGYLPELTEYESDHPGFSYLPTVTRPPVDDRWEGLRGRVVEHLRSDTLAETVGFDIQPGTMRAFLCGNQAMITDVETLLMDRGFQPRWMDEGGDIHTEIYY
ncbi:hypothetical protein GF324_10935 [bacterium]|nr:hypothetical protein [bacterium]